MSSGNSFWGKQASSGICYQSAFAADSAQVGQDSARGWAATTARTALVPELADQVQAMIGQPSSQGAPSERQERVAPQSWQPAAQGQQQCRQPQGQVRAAPQAAPMPEVRPQPQEQQQPLSKPQGNDHHKPQAEFQAQQNLQLQQNPEPTQQQAPAQVQAQGQVQSHPQPQNQAWPQAQPQTRQQPAATQSQGQAQPGYQPPAYQAAFQQAAFPQGQPVAYYMPMVGAQPTDPKKDRKWVARVIVIVAVLLFLAFCMKMCTDSLMSIYSPSSGYYPGSLTEDAVGVIDIDGVIQYDGSQCSPEGLKTLLDTAAADEHITAVVLRVNSGGGTATAGEEMAEYVREFKETSGKPVVVSSASINASAAYMISSQADHIFVAKSTEIGAIGTVMELTDLSGLLEKLGVKMDVIASADSKDSSYGYRPLTKEERAYYQDMVNKINEMFIENVVEGRAGKMTDAEVRKLATGLVYTGADAVENKLADEIGTREDAVEKASELAGSTSTETVDLTLSGYDLSSLSYLLGESNVTLDDIIGALKEAEYARIK